MKALIDFAGFFRKRRGLFANFHTDHQLRTGIFEQQILAKRDLLPAEADFVGNAVNG